MHDSVTDSLVLAVLFAALLLGYRGIAAAQELPAAQQSPVSEEPFDHAKFLAVLGALPTPSTEDLKQFYHRPRQIPLRLESWNSNAQELSALGKKIFFDTRLSKSGLMSCSSCHNPTLHWGDGLARSPENESRRSMSLYNLAWDKQFLWNARAGSLMAQSALALSAKKGMDVDLAQLAAKINSISGYRPYFASAFRLSDSERQSASLARTAAALEVFVSSIVSAPTEFDRWIEGDETAISESAQNGFRLFNGKAGCANCHNSWRFSDGQIYNTGLTSQCEDAKKERTKKEWNNGLFKAVGLRFISARGPYMHDGSLSSLTEVVEFYNRGGDTHCEITSALMRPLGLTKTEIQDLVEFLDTLGSSGQEYVLPELPK